MNQEAMNPLYKVQERVCFRTNVRIKIPEAYPDSLFNELFEVLYRVNRKFNSHVTDSVIDRINKQAGKFVEVDEETNNLFRNLIYWSDMTDGGFDPTVMPLLRLWGFYSASSSARPTDTEIENMLSRVDYRRIEIEGNRIRIDKEQEITTGGFLKGYGLDCLRDELNKHGIHDAIINAGGSSMACLNTGDHPYWKIVVNDPLRQRTIANLKVSNRCCSTTSGMSSKLVFSGISYGHIVSPENGQPVQNLQCGVLTPDCLSGDILSTGLLHLSIEQFISQIKLIAQSISIDGYLITGDKQFICTDNIQEFFIQPKPI